MKLIKTNAMLMFSLTGVTLLAGSIFAAWAITDNADDVNIKVTVSSTHNVTFYSSYSNDSSAWQVDGNQLVADGGTVSSVPSVSLTGYTFKGWRTSLPTLGNYSKEYTSEQAAALPITADTSFYPVFESNDSYAYANSSFYKLNEDCTLNVSSVSNVYVGKRYNGVTGGIPSVTSSVTTAQNLYSSSGIYQFHEDGKIFRKIGFQPNNDWRQLWNSAHPSFTYHTWGDYEYDYIRPFDAGNYIYYAYIPATNHNFMIIRQAPDASSINWDNNHSDTISLSNTFGAGNYSSSSIVLGQYGNSGWSGWNSSKTWWFNP